MRHILQSRVTFITKWARYYKVEQLLQSMALQKENQRNEWRRGVVVITTAQLHSTKPELRLCASSNSARGVSEIRDGEDL